LTPAWTLVAPVLVAGWALLLWGLERLRPYERGPFLREGLVTDLFLYTFAQSYVCALAIGALIRGLDGATGLSRLGLVGGWPVWGQVAFFVVTHDLYIYCFHRWQHSSPLLWRLHEAHHSSRRVDWVAGLRSHAIEILINQTVEFAPMVLLGAAPAVPVIKSLIGAVWGLWIHANVDVRTGPLQWVINGPEAHRWHHAMDEDAHGRNFATKLALWDRLFGTAWLPPVERRPAGYGLSDVAFPRSYLRQQLFAFRPFGRVTT
jgi:sterol desaturase/sphingolipid hydroxylase (fatty acid hydroxylase superfamily)